MHIHSLLYHHSSNQDDRNIYRIDQSVIPVHLVWNKNETLRKYYIYSLKSYCNLKKNLYNRTFTMVAQTHTHTR